MTLRAYYECDNCKATIDRGGAGNSGWVEIRVSTRLMDATIFHDVEHRPEFTICDTCLCDETITTPIVVLGRTNIDRIQLISKRELDSKFDE